MTLIASDRLAASLAAFLAKINEHSCMLSKTKQPFGICTITPKSANVPLPTNEIWAELENHASEHSKTKQLGVICIRYFSPPLMPEPKENISQKPISSNDYQLTFEVPQFDQKWQQTVIARNLIYCALDPELYEYLDWFELQEEAIRLVPLIHQTVKELEISAQIKHKLCLPAMPIFESFIYSYGPKDSNLPLMSTIEMKKWQAKEHYWKERYALVLPLIEPAKTVHDLYTIAREKAVSSRNPMVKGLFWAFVDHIEKKLIESTQLPEEVKKCMLNKLRKTKKRATTKGKYVAKKRPAISLSDIECGQMLYVMIRDYLSQKNKALAEAIFFIWIAQHGAFSNHHLTVDAILSLKITNIDVEMMTIQVHNKEINTTDGLNRILSEYIATPEKKNRRKFFQNITNDSLEDIISKYSMELYGNEGRLLPRDFLEKVHVVPGVRMPLDLRRKIIEQEELVKNSPYRVQSKNIKKNILESIKKNPA